MKFLDKLRNLTEKAKANPKKAVHDRFEKMRSQCNDDPPSFIPSIKCIIHNDALPQGVVPIFEGCDNVLCVQDGKIMCAPKWKINRVRIDSFELSSNNIEELKTLVLNTIKMLDDASENQVIVVAERQSMMIGGNPDDTFTFDACYYSTNLSIPGDLKPQLYGFGWGLNFEKIYPNNYLIYKIMQS